jgi:hypothetical protein
VDAVIDLFRILWGQLEAILADTLGAKGPAAGRGGGRRLPEANDWKVANGS